MAGRWDSCSSFTCITSAPATTDSPKEERPFSMHGGGEGVQLTDAAARTSIRQRPRYLLHLCLSELFQQEENRVTQGIDVMIGIPLFPP